MNKFEIKIQYKNKLKLINEYNKFYYDRNKPKVSDKDYDELKKYCPYLINSTEPGSFYLRIN